MRVRWRKAVLPLDPINAAMHLQELWGLIWMHAQILQSRSSFGIQSLAHYLSRFCPFLIQQANNKLVFCARLCLCKFLPIFQLFGKVCIYLIEGTLSRIFAPLIKNEITNVHIFQPTFSQYSNLLNKQIFLFILIVYLY